MWLLDLPIELLYCILHHLDLEKDVNALVQANSNLHQLLNRYLYRRNIKRSRSSALLWAAEHGQSETAQKVLSYGASINTEDMYHGNALQIASHKGHLNVAKLLIDSGVDVNTQSGLYGSALQAATAGGHAEMASLLLSKGADVNVQGGFYATALEAASAGGIRVL